MLPPEVQRNGVTAKKQSSALLQVIAIFSPKGTPRRAVPVELRHHQLLDALKRVPGVGDAALFGALDYSMRIWLKLDRMASLDITPQRRGQRRPVAERAGRGRPGRRGAADGRGRLPAQHQTQGRLTDVEEFENIVVRAKPDGALVRIKDIARVELGAKTSDPVGALQRQAGGRHRRSTSCPAPMRSPPPQACSKADEGAEPRLPDDVAYDVMYDTTVFVQATIESVKHTLIEAFVLVASWSSSSSATSAPR